jgi:hypothetical protein
MAALIALCSGQFVVLDSTLLRMLRTAGGASIGRSSVRAEGESLLMRRV